METIKDFRNNDVMTKKILGLGINPDFTKNPAFKQIIFYINSLIGQLNLSSDKQQITVLESDGKLSFSGVTEFNVEFEFQITKMDDNNFKCIRTVRESDGFSPNLNAYIIKKYAAEGIFNLNDLGITIYSNNSFLSNTNPDQRVCNNSTSCERREYNNYGIMVEREEKRYKDGELSLSIANADVDSMLCIPRQGFTDGFMKDKFETKTLIRREYLDVARVVEMNEGGIVYSASERLNMEVGLQNLRLNNGLRTGEDVITPLSQEEIESLIQKESDPKVAEGLRQYAINRDKYYYNSLEDKYYINQANKLAPESQGRK